MERGRQAHAAQIVAAGDAALLVRFGSRPGLVASRRALALVSALDAMQPPGLLDVVPAYASVLVRFDPLTLAPAVMTAMLRAALRASDVRQLPRGRIIRVPVYYGGEDGPDLDAVARMLAMSPEEVIQRHTATLYQVAFLGFLAGFPYLAGLPRALAVPRLATPRTRVPAGSVAIAERQAGVYPVKSPGGWRILGRTPLQLFDPERDRPSLLRPGDRVRFYAANVAHGATSGGVALGSVRTPMGNPAQQPHAGATPGIPWLRVSQPGIQATVQDRGRLGYARYGVSASGAADPDALALGNALLANAPDAATLEITGGAARFEALAPSVVVVTGAPCTVQVNQRVVHRHVTLALVAGDTLELGALVAGMRAYLCVAGGVACPTVMGSRATDLRAQLGGLHGRALHSGDVLQRDPTGGERIGRTLPDGLARLFPGRGDWRLRVLPGPQSAQAPDELAGLLCARFSVDARSDRMGIRLERRGPCLAGGQTLSEGLPRGAVQLPPDGQPVLLLADAQATGGYHVPAVVIGADLWRIGQLRPGDSVRFSLVTPEEALAALRQRSADIARVANQPAPTLLMDGFAEWSQDADVIMLSQLSQRATETGGDDDA